MQLACRNFRNFGSGNEGEPARAEDIGVLGDDEGRGVVANYDLEVDTIVVEGEHLTADEIEYRLRGLDFHAVIPARRVDRAVIADHVATRKPLRLGNEGRPPLIERLAAIPLG